MTLLRKQAPTFSGIAAGQTAVCDLDLGSRYHVFWLVLGNNAIAANELANLAGEIRVKINGKVQRTHTAVELNAINTINGEPYVTAGSPAYAEKTSGTSGQADYRHYLPIFFAEPWRKGNLEAQAKAWNAVGINSLQIEVDVVAGLAAPIVSGFYEYDAPTNNQIGLIQKWIRQTFPAVGTQQDFNTIDRRDFIEAIHLFPTVEGTPKFVNVVKFTLNGTAILDQITTLQNQAMLLGRELSPDVAAVPRFDLVFDHDDPINSALPTNPGGTRALEMTLHVEYNAAANGNLVAMIIRTGPPE
jgi:hypothetical protein